MSPLFAIIVLVLVVAQVALPKRLGFLPLVIAGLHLGNIEILPELTPARLLILIGLARAAFEGFIVWPSMKTTLDKAILAFAFFALLSSLGHRSDQWVPSPFNARAGLVLNAFGSFLYGRSYLPDISSFKRYAVILPFLLIPLAFLLTVEKRTRVNFYSSLGSRSDTPMVRDGKARAVGPFRHPILAGTAGASALPFAFLLWKLGKRKSALVSVGTCLGIVLASSSSGPLAAVAVSVGAAVFWRWRQHLKYLVWAGVLFTIIYVVAKGRGPWFIMASIDLVGGSTGWHRAELMDQGFIHLKEWWLCGTDYTRHWMASGMRWNPNHVDLTNYYLHLGVLGGLPLMLCLIALIVLGFRMLVGRMALMRALDDPDEIILWCACTSFATHVISFVSISYFDQMYIFFYILLGAILGLVSSPSSMVTISPAQQSPVPAAPKLLRYYS